MLIKVACVIEIMAIIIGLFGIYGKKFKFDLSIISIIIILIFAQEIIALLSK